jgi:DNA-directed RNA polymerase specialized sigma24 family protein
MYYFDDLSSHEIAEILDVPVGTVYRRLHEARRRLRADLDKSNPSD